MKLASTTKNILIATLSMASVVVIGGTFSDAKFNSNSFMNKTTSVEKRLDDKVRNVASLESVPAVVALEKNEVNSKRINGIWNIYNIVGDQEKVNFNARFELVGNGLVKVGGELVYMISYLSEQNTIALYKEVSEGKYEIIEARKIETKAQMAKVLEAQKALAQEGLTVNAQEIDLSVNSSSSKVSSKFAGQKVSGSVRISNGMILNLELALNGEAAFSFTEAVEIQAAGAFVAQANIGNSTETISGIIINSGNGSYTLRIATGDFQGTTIVFDSSDASEENNEVQAEQTIAPEQAVQIQEQVQVERKALMDAMSAEMPAPTTNEENANVAFSFENKAE